MLSANQIFISYSNQDRLWIDDYLRPLLTAAQVPFVIDDQDFVIGQKIETSIIEAIQRCPYTLFVMTPHWVKGKWTHYEKLIAEEHLQQSVGRQILPIKLRECDVPPSIADRLYLDLRDPLQWDDGMAKLLKQIGASEEVIAGALNGVAKKTLLVLFALMCDSRILEQTKSLRGMFVEIQRGNRRLEIHKQLHDDMHSIQQTMDQLQKELPESGIVDWPAIFFVLSALCVNLDKLIAHADVASEEGVDVSFVEFLKPLREELDRAYQENAEQLLKSVVGNLMRRLDMYLPYLNARILEYVQGRKLQTMIDGLDAVLHRLIGNPKLKFDDRADALLDEFKSGIYTLTEIDVVIRELVSDHCQLQDAEMNFKQLLRPGHSSLYDITLQWRLCKQWVSKLKMPARYERLLRSFNRLSDRLADETCIRNDAYEAEIRLKFHEFAHETRIAFNKLDVDLLAFCYRLNPHNAEIQQILDRMQNDDWASR